jgi:hypothetical protein
MTLHTFACINRTASRSKCVHVRHHIPFMRRMRVHAYMPHAYLPVTMTSSRIHVMQQTSHLTDRIDYGRVQSRKILQNCACMCTCQHHVLARHVILLVSHTCRFTRVGSHVSVQTYSQVLNRANDIEQSYVVHVYTCTPYIYVYAYMYIHAYTYTHTYIHTHA